MDWATYRDRFEAAARAQGRPPAFIHDCLEYAEPLMRAGLPVLFDTEHLALEIGTSEGQLKELLANPTRWYVRYAVPKRAGGYRHIHEPVGPLRTAQRWVLRHILDAQSPHPAATAFTHGRSIKLNACGHVGQRMVLSLDVENFFDSIRRDHVHNLFHRMGFSPDVSVALTCLTVLWNQLPQGASTSPAISNLVMYGVDETLTALATSLSIHYTRYADDLTFSGSFRVSHVLDRVQKALQKLGLTLNSEKTRLMLRHERQEVTGVTVNEHMQAPRTVRRRLRQEIHYLKKYGEEQHFARNFSFYNNRLAHLRGLAEFILFLNPNDRDAKDAIAELGRVRY